MEEVECGQKKESRKEREGLPSRTLMPDELSIKIKWQGLASGLFTQHNLLRELANDLPFLHVQFIPASYWIGLNRNK